MSIASFTTERIFSLFCLGLTLALASSAQTTVDLTFNAVPSKSLTSPTELQQVVQPDGKVIVFGIKGVANGVAKGDVFRLNADGTLDTTFDYCGCRLTSVRNVMLAPAGKIIVAGGEGNGAKMIRLNPDGSIDPTFLATSPGPASSPTARSSLHYSTRRWVTAPFIWTDTTRTAR